MVGRCLVLYNTNRQSPRYFDGSWKDKKSAIDQTQPAWAFNPPPPKKRKVSSPASNSNIKNNDDDDDDNLYTSASSTQKMHSPRFIGAFGVEGWATRSGSNLLTFGESVAIERQKMQFLTKGKGKSKSSASIASRRKTSDIVVRFTNSRGEEVGRLAQGKAAFISTLLDQKICLFEGICFYAPERIRTNDTINLQLKCFLLPDAFEQQRLQPANDNRVTDLFAAQETEEEKALRLRQIALVKIFQEVNLEPVHTNEATQKHKRTGLLQVAEMGETWNPVDDGSVTSDKDSTLSNVEDAEDNQGKELEQDQLDALYRKCPCNYHHLP